MTRRPKIKEPKYPMGGNSQYANVWQIGDSAWELKMVKNGIFKGKEASAGVCDPETRTMFLDMAQTRREMFSALIHEQLHAIAVEYGLTIKHKMIYDLEVAITNLLLDNAIAYHRVIYGD